MCLAGDSRRQCLELKDTVGQQRTPSVQSDNTEHVPYVSMWPGRERSWTLAVIKVILPSQ